VLDDYQGEVLALPYWSRLGGRVAVEHFRDTLHDVEGLARRLAPYEMGLILAAARRIPQEDRALREGRCQTSLGVELAGKTLGVVGLGRIGSRIAAFGTFLGMRVLAWGPTLTPERAAAAGVLNPDVRPRKLA
jgi:phosphoglycerate dehydrogenase-like enzyme